MAGMPGVTPNMVIQPEPSGPAIPPEYAPSVNYGQNTPNPVAEEVSSPGAQAASTAASVSSVPPLQSNSGTSADSNNDGIAANYGHGRGATVPGAVGGGMPAADPSKLSPVDGAHHFLGKAAHAVWNALDSKHEDPNTGKIVNDKPGTFFRNLLGGMMIGAAAGYGAPRGAGGQAGVEAVQKQQEMIHRQQQQKIENQRNEKKDTRDETLFNAQMTRFNIENIADLQRLEGTTQKEHQDFVASRASVVEAHRLARHKPVRENVNEEQHIADLKDPNQADKLNLEWEPVGIAPYVTKVDGKDVITYQMVWNAYDKTSEIPLLPKTLDRWEESGAITHAERGILDKSLKIDPVTQQPMMPYGAFISKDTNSRTLEVRNREKKALDDAETDRNDEHLLRGAQTREATLKGNEAAGAISDAAHDRRMRGFSESADRKLLNNGGDWTLSKDPKDKTHLTADEFMAKQWGPNGVQAKINNLQTTLNNIDNRLRYATDGTAEYNELWKERISTNTELETEKSHSAPAGLLKTQPPPASDSGNGPSKVTPQGIVMPAGQKAPEGTYENHAVKIRAVDPHTGRAIYRVAHSAGTQSPEEFEAQTTQDFKKSFAASTGRQPTADEVNQALEFSSDESGLIYDVPEGATWDSPQAAAYAQKVRQKLNRSMGAN